MFEFLYNIDKYFTEMQNWVINMFTFTNRGKDDNYIIISEYSGNDIWLLDEFSPNNVTYGNK